MRTVDSVHFTDDHHTIVALINRFARCLDQKDFDGYAEAYAEDGVLQTPRVVTKAARASLSTSGTISGGTSPRSM